jgi:hypothetical protein
MTVSQMTATSTEESHQQRLHWLAEQVLNLDVLLDRWEVGLSRLGRPPHTERHVPPVARLHRDKRYDRTADGVERVTGIPPQSIETFVAARRDFYLGGARGAAPARYRRYPLSTRDR